MNEETQSEYLGCLTSEEAYSMYPEIVEQELNPTK
jgi:hypothetical protein|tara:strand:- start:315 stop:419 length:105 start_codon:yes stop_codon:yes gene_type:complete